MTQLKQLLAPILLLVLATSCGDSNGIEFGDDNHKGSVTVSNDIAARMETPALRKDGSTVVVSHSSMENGRQVIAYSLEYDKNVYHSRWVAFRFDGDTRAKNTSRSNEPFADDPSLSSSLYIGSNGFGWDYNRGHLCASADRLYSATANEMTFYMSNMSPQLASFNQGYWVTLEGQVQARGRDTSFADTLYVVKGGTILKDQILTYVTRSNGKKVAVPKYYFMALLKIKNGVYSSIAFLMEHKEYGYTSNNKAPKDVILKHAVSVNDLEEATGIDFFPNLPDKEEESVEEQLVPTNWIK